MITQNRRLGTSRAPGSRAAALLVAVLAAVALPAMASAATASPATTGSVPSSTGTAQASPDGAVRPATQTIVAGETATFTASFDGLAPAAVEWQTAAAGGPWTDVTGHRGSVLTLSATRAMDGHLFRAVLGTARGSSTSPPATLHVRRASHPTGEPAGPVIPTVPTTAEAAATATPTPTATSTPATSTPATSSRTTSTPAASTPSATPTLTPSSSPVAGAPYGTVAATVLALGQDQIAIGHNFTPGTAVRVTLAPTGTDLGTYPVAADGTVTTRFSTAGLGAGTYRVTWTPI